MSNLQQVLGSAFDASQLQNGGAGSEQKKQQEEKEKRENEQKNVILHKILTPEALERLNRIGLVKPEQKAQYEDTLIRAAHSFGQKLDENQLIDFLDHASSNKAAVRVTVKRKASSWDDDDDDI
ncbi:MAG: hypothetical protein EZS28_006979 [Streblomastix strix]|uniref:Programmed cell death protein 5 n=1 Tax=Streblomastix strix TaxID=222440 RepID=A0A5J4WTP5_9EUKA|nr:MAG: hypothetical protein EZS28_006979 [Streblomastix strix]